MTSNRDNINKRRLRNDKLGGYIVTAFGGLVLLTLVVLISHLISQALPLWFSPVIQQEHQLPLPDNSRIAATGDIFGGQPLVLHDQECKLGLYGYSGQGLTKVHEYIRPCEHTLTTVSFMGENAIVDISPHGQVRVFPVRALALSAYSSQSPINEGARLKTISALDSGQASLSFSLPEDRWHEKQAWQIELSKKWVVVKITTQQGIFLRWVNRQNPTQVIDKFFENITDVYSLAGAEMMLVERKKQLLLARLFSAESQLEVLTSTNNRYRLQARVFSLEKDRTFFFQDTDNRVSRWILRRDDKQLGFTQTYQIELEKNERLIDVKEHASMNVIAALTNTRHILLLNRISGEIVSREKLAHSVEHISWFGNKLYGYDAHNLYVWSVDYLSGITTWDSLFKPQHYEGYDEQDMVWQTTSASDYQESKFSITPLIIGSIKASLLALVIAIPLAIGAAIYSGYFAKSRLRHIVKPAIEMLEAIPSVLIGFIAAIWLSPKAEQFLFSFAFFIVVVPFMLIGVALLQRNVVDKLTVRLRHGSELLLAIVGVFILGYISVEWAPDWFFSIMNVDGYDFLVSQSHSPIGKTTVVVAIALGVAISPSIYSLAEDAISGVPDNLKHASFALGATRLQTLMHVVLQVALPGIVAAIMIGFGRAFGETMIVLMVTGNTPVASWGLIEGLRALTANLAIELPEADASSAHYQILFLTACILFLFTFIVNTLAELLRQRLRSRAYHG